LLPREDYFEWVRATAKFVLAFGIGITPDPEKASSKDNLTVVVTPDGYPEYGDILAWLRKNAPDVRVDAIRIENPGGLKDLLQTRIDAGLKFGQPPSTEEIAHEFVQKENEPDNAGDADDLIEVPESLVASPPDMADLPLELNQVVDDIAPAEPAASPDGQFRLVWPTDYPKVTQAFSANPEIYSKWGLPGHEGLDIRAPLNTNVYASADGTVYVAIDSRGDHPYGKHVRIRHEGGYRTIYAHLASTAVRVGDVVSVGQVIGRADSTGNSTGSHLHLTLKKEGATARRETHFKGDIIDPTPFLIHPQGVEDLNMASRPSFGWSRPTLLGVNVRDDGFLHDADFRVVQEAHLEAVKIQENTPTRAIQRLLLTRNDLFIVARLAFELGQTAITPQEWVARILPDLDRLYAMGIRYFEIHQSPNLQAYGWNHAWHSGGGFARWWLDIVHQLRDRFPDSKFGFPGVSPGGQVEGQRLDAQTFLEQAEDGIQVADWLGVNCFWADGMELQHEEKGAFYRIARRRYPSKLLIVTEFGNVNVLTSSYVKGNEYVQFWHAVKQTPGVAAVFSQVISSSKGFDGMVWREESGDLTHIPLRVMNR
jgi:murein DD-endopeptidase MepM/ murein hydrolase activator NlpD